MMMTDQDVVEAKRCFLERTGVVAAHGAAIESRNSALQRSRTYLSGVTERQAEILRMAIDRSIMSLAEQYRVPCDDDIHCDRIVGLARSLSEGHQAVLADGRFRIGIAQKALNLHLKYLWCLEPERPEPPHCTLDGQILGATKHPGAWTRLDSIDEYREWTSHVRDYAKSKGFESTVVWELFTWKPAQGQSRASHCH